MGDLIPTILRTKHNLEQLAMKKLTHCGPLVKALIDSLQARFSKYVDLTDSVTSYIVASVTHPYFKLRWVPADKLNYARNLFLAAAKHKLESTRAETVPESHSVQASSSNDDFFSFSRNPGTQHPEGTSDVECLQYLEDCSCDLECLNKYPLVRSLFIEYNAPIPSSAPVERLFSYAGMVLTCKRSCMSDTNFEQQLLLKANNNFLRKLNN